MPKRRKKQPTRTKKKTRSTKRKKGERKKGKRKSAVGKRPAGNRPLDSIGVVDHGYGAAHEAVRLVKDVLEDAFAPHPLGRLGSLEGLGARLLWGDQRTSSDHPGLSGLPSDNIPARLEAAIEVIERIEAASPREERTISFGCLGTVLSVHRLVLLVYDAIRTPLGLTLPCLIRVMASNAGVKKTIRQSLREAAWLHTELEKAPLPSEENWGTEAGPLSQPLVGSGILLNREDDVSADEILEELAKVAGQYVTQNAERILDSLRRTVHDNWRREFELLEQRLHAEYLRVWSQLSASADAQKSARTPEKKRKRNGTVKRKTERPEWPYKTWAAAPKKEHGERITKIEIKKTHGVSTSTIQSWEENDRNPLNKSKTEDGTTTYWFRDAELHLKRWYRIRRRPPLEGHPPT